MVVEVLEPNFHKFKESLKKVKTIDDILLTHNNFLDECLKECLLTDQNLFRILTKLNQTTHFFSRIIFRFFQGVQTEETYFMAQEINEGRSAFKFGDEEDEKDTFEYDRLKKRRERLGKESDNIKKAITD
jgi:hypothetical protein